MQKKRQQTTNQVYKRLRSGYLSLIYIGPSNRCWRCIILVTSDYIYCMFHAASMLPQCNSLNRSSKSVWTSLSVFRNQKMNTFECLRLRTYGNVFLRFCIVSSNELVVLDSLENSILNSTKTQENVSVCTGPELASQTHPYSERKSSLKFSHKIQFLRFLNTDYKYIYIYIFNFLCELLIRLRWFESRKFFLGRRTRFRSTLACFYI